MLSLWERSFAVCVAFDDWALTDFYVSAPQITFSILYMANYIQNVLCEDAKVWIKYPLEANTEAQLFNIRGPICDWCGPVASFQKITIW